MVTYSAAHLLAAVAVSRQLGVRRRQFLGEGGAGHVYRGLHLELDKPVAIKVLRPEFNATDAFRQEARASAGLPHPNIVTVHSVEEAEGVHFITMELVKGKTVTEVIPKRGLSLNKFFEIAIPLADAVSAAHEKGITHRDL